MTTVYVELPGKTFEVTANTPSARGRVQQYQVTGDRIKGVAQRKQHRASFLQSVLDRRAGFVVKTVYPTAWETGVYVKGKTRRDTNQWFASVTELGKNALVDGYFYLRSTTTKRIVRFDLLETRDGELVFTSPQVLDLVVRIAND